jgi:DNA-binding NtrC family response regulator
MALLRRYQWPGNVRELRNVMARAALLATGDALGVEHLPREKLEAQLPAPGTHLRTELEEVERRRILSILERCGGNQSRAAKLLGISRNTLIARLNAYGVARPRGGGT